MEAIVTDLQHSNPPIAGRINRSLIGAVLILGLAIDPVRTFLELSLVGHMLVQIPLLVVAGWFIGLNHLNAVQRWNANGIPGLLISFFASIFWMLPRWLDAALSETLWEIAKFATVPMLIGVVLSISWPRLSDLARGYVWANLISMLAFMGWLYIAAPVRICNNYLVDQQVVFGYSAMAIAVAIALYWTGRGFFGSWEHKARD